MNAAPSTALPTPSRDWALFLDVDGTLVEIADTPDSVRADPRLPGVLTAAANTLGGAVALVSGRPIATLDRLLHPVRLPAAGLHGLERRTIDGTVSAAVRPPAIREAVAAAQHFADGHDGVLVEDKRLTVALHYRSAPDLGPAVRAFADGLLKTLDAGLRIQTGKMVVEIRPAGADKGTVVEAFMNEAPFAGRVPVFIGDDVTDEAGFEAVNRLGGQSIRVGAEQPTAARFRIPGVEPLLTWLAEWTGGRDAAAQDAVGCGR
jgi:trehalose 6-phosphate phosphatase